jgi:hypothetical protein
MIIKPQIVCFSAFFGELEDLSEDSEITLDSELVKPWTLELMRDWMEGLWYIDDREKYALFKSHLITGMENLGSMLIELFNAQDYLDFDSRFK